MRNFLVAALMGLLIIVHIITLYDGHNWGEDFSQYILHAKNLLEGQPYSSRITLDPLMIYPVGFPLLLAPLVAVFGINFKILKLLNILFWFASIFLLGHMFKDKMERSVLLFVQVLLAASSYFFIFKQNVLSDIPFLFFVVLSISFFQQFEKYKTLRSWIVFLVVAGMAFLIRPVGGCLFAAAFIWIILHKETKRLFLSFAAVLIAILAIHYSFVEPRSGHILMFYQHPLSYLYSILQNAWVVIYSVINVLCSFLTLNGFKLGIVASLIWFVNVLALVIWAMRRRQFDFILLFILTYLAVVTFWSGITHPPNDFIRFAIPVAVLGLFWGLSKFNQTHAPFVKGALVILIGLNLLQIWRQYDFNDDVITKNEVQQMFQWVKTNLEEDEHYMIWTARTTALLTERVGAVHWIAWDPQNADWQERINRYQIKFLIMNKYSDQHLIDALLQKPASFTPAWENPVFTVFRVLP